MIENFNVFDFELTKEEMEAFDPYDTGEGIIVDRRDPERVKMYFGK